MKILKLKEVVVAPGMEYSASSYPGNGVYWLPNRNQLVSVANGMCLSVNVLPELVEDVPEGSVSGGVSESFVFELINKTVELVNMRPPRSVRAEDWKKGHHAES